MRSLLCAIVFLLSAVRAVPQVPECYRTVDAIVWVVSDLGAAVQGWARLGFPGIENMGIVEITEGVRFRGRGVQQAFGLAKGRIGETAVFWIQPTGGEGAYSEFAKKRGSGIFSLVHRAPSLEALEAEVRRMESLDIGVLQRGELRTGSGEVRYVFLDTESEGKYVLGLLAGDIETAPWRCRRPCLPLLASRSMPSPCARWSRSQGSGPDSAFPSSATRTPRSANCATAAGQEISTCAWDGSGTGRFPTSGLSR